MIDTYLQKLKREHAVRVFEWVKYRHDNEGKEFKSEDEMRYLITDISQMNKFLFKGVDNAILDLDYKKGQKALEKAHKQENKHGIDSGGHGPKAHQSHSSPGRKGTTRPDTAKKAKIRLEYVPLEQEWIEWKYPPGFRFNPTKQEVQMMIKKATTI